MDLVITVVQDPVTISLKHVGKFIDVRMSKCFGHTTPVI